MTSVSSDRARSINSGLAIKVPVVAATTAPITLSGAQTIDGISCVTGDRVLVMDQASSIQNGIYVVDSGDWSRAADFDGPYDVTRGTLVYCIGGTSNAGAIFYQNTDDPNPGTTAMTFILIPLALAGVSAFIITLLDDLTAAAARATLDAQQDVFTTRGDIVTAGIAAVAQRLALGAAGTVLKSDGADAVWGFLTAIGADLYFSGDLTPSAITADQNDYSPVGLSTATVLRLATDATRSLTGLSGGSDGRILILHNVGSNTLNLSNNNASSSAANRFFMGGDVAIAAAQSAVLWYDSTVSLWKAIAVPSTSSSGGGGTGSNIVMSIIGL